MDKDKLLAHLETAAEEAYKSAKAAFETYGDSGNSGYWEGRGDGFYLLRFVIESGKFD